MTCPLAACLKVHFTCLCQSPLSFGDAKTLSCATHPESRGGRGKGRVIIVRDLQTIEVCVGGMSSAISKRGGGHTCCPSDRIVRPSHPFQTSTRRRRSNGWTKAKSSPPSLAVHSDFESLHRLGKVNKLRQFSAFITARADAVPPIFRS